MNNPTIVSGEASETDSEEENVKFELAEPKATVQGAVITGEDSESDENDGSISSAVSALHEIDSPTKKKTCDNYNSLLHQKLRECNEKLRNDVENICDHVITDAKKNLISIDQQLIKSQLTMQNALTSLKSVRTNSISLKNKLQYLLSVQFIPDK